MSTLAALKTAVSNAAPNSTILVADGTYDFGASSDFLYLDKPGLTLRGQSGDATQVIFEANYATGFGQIVLTVGASDVTIADLTVQHAYDHAIHVAPNLTTPATITGTRIYRVIIVDPGQQGIKVNPDEPGFTHLMEQGEIACTQIRLTAAGRTHVRDNCYTGGIDIHAARGWAIRDNLIEGFFCSAGLSEHAIHCWKGCRDTLIERNALINNARGVGLGLGLGTAGRIYADTPCGAVTDYGHVGGIVRNNFIVATQAELFSSAAGFDTGIGLEEACGDTQVVHNSVFSSQAPASSSIEWRFAGTTATVVNNLTSHAQRARDGAAATTAGNLATATAAMFGNPATGDLHLKATASAAIDHGAPLDAGIADDDIDREPRTGARDIGADEL